jgi:hypothetical protein
VNNNHKNAGCVPKLRKKLEHDKVMRQFRRLILWEERVVSATAIRRPIMIYLWRLTPGASKKVARIKADDERGLRRTRANPKAQSRALK